MKFTLPFVRCVVSPAGATHFQTSDLLVNRVCRSGRVGGVWGYGILVQGAWHQVPGKLPGARYLVPGTGYPVPGTWDRKKSNYFSGAA